MSDFRTLCETYPKDNDYPARTFRLLALTRVLEGKQYDCLEHPFSEEKNGAGEYIPLAKRRPSAKTRLCPTVVNDSVSLLFSEGHFPAVECADETTRDTLTDLVKETQLNALMIDAATRGSVGSIAVLLRVLKGRVFFTVIPTAFLTPKWQADAPDMLDSVTERYKVKGDVLRQAGYSIPEDQLAAQFWFQRTWNATAENWYLPQTLEDAKDGKAPQIDAKRTTSHKFGFVPMVWVRNLPGGDDTDGACTFPCEAIDTQIEADYLLSQGGRGLKYQSDPTLHIKEPAFGEQVQMVRGAANAVVTSTEGDAKLLEISGDAAAAVMEWVRGLRELALEGAGGNRANADKLSAAQSGRAMELMNQALIWLADKLRIAYGEGALLSLLNMVAQASNKYELVNKKGKPLGKLSDEDLSLRWPDWYAPTCTDKQTQAVTLDTLRLAGLLSQPTAVKAIAPSYDIADPADEIREIAKSPPPPNAQLPKEPTANPEAED
ncbi:phage portal protein [Chitinimonas naiadis]